MTARVLFVDDDPRVLSAFRRGLHKRFDLKIAEGGKAGLEAIAKDGPFAVVVSDQQMPEMDGITFLKHVMERTPNTVRMMLTGNADQKTAIDAVNEGHVFRFISKPSSPDAVASAVDEAVAFYRLAEAERELLERTLAGSIKVLIDVLSLRDPESVRLTTPTRRWAGHIAAALKMSDRWVLDMAAMLWPLGRIVLPQELREKLHAGIAPNETEIELIARTPQVAHDLIANIPRMDPVAEAIRLQATDFDGSGLPADGPAGHDIPIEARILRVVIDLAHATNGEPPTAAAFDLLASRAGAHDPVILDAARQSLQNLDGAAPGAPTATTLELPVANLQPGDHVLEDIVAEGGVLLLSSGYELSPALVEKLRQVRKLRSIVEPIRVRRQAA